MGVGVNAISIQRPVPPFRCGHSLGLEPRETARAKCQARFRSSERYTCDSFVASCGRQGPVGGSRGYLPALHRATPHFAARATCSSRRGELHSKIAA